ncbi:eukaryotic translation initiation factor 2A isoform X1 [Aphis craccivora]|uniref:Eukaryotic translation initiation factor 2A isoform X1 n=1 Tax=Aphis craccivora TaxID=307492 RepID=A0A6G0W0P0_APHCR|nr:eukaryotic translation initiation factor 2A isoform X1 [Aphis craccivora]
MLFSPNGKHFAWINNSNTNQILIRVVIVKTSDWKTIAEVYYPIVAQLGYSIFFIIHPDKCSCTNKAFCNLKWHVSMIFISLNSSKGVVKFPLEICSVQVLQFSLSAVEHVPFANHGNSFAKR